MSTKFRGWPLLLLAIFFAKPLLGCFHRLSSDLNGFMAQITYFFESNPLIALLVLAWLFRKFL